MKKWMKRKNYTAQSKKHLRDKNLQEAAKVLSLMEVDDAVDVLDEVDDATKKQVVLTATVDGQTLTCIVRVN